MASEMIFPISVSLLAEIVPTWVISCLSFTGFAIFWSSSATSSTPLSIPFLSSMGFMPAATSFAPSR